MNSLMVKLEFIQQQCADPKDRKKKQEDEKNMDDFTKLRKKIAQQIKDVRTQLEERNELLGKTENNTTTVRMSAEIRAKIKGIVKDTETLDSLQKKEFQKIEDRKAKNKKVEEKDEKQVEQRSEVVELCWKHIEECRHIERQGFGQTGALGSNDTTTKPLITELPDVDGDEGFQLLRKNDQIIDQKLELASQGVRVLKEMASDMGKEIEVQTVMLNEVTEKVDRTQAHLDNINRRLKKTLVAVRKGDRFILDFILLVILLALGGFLYNMLAKK